MLSEKSKHVKKIVFFIVKKIKITSKFDANDFLCFSADDDEFLANEPELSETLQLLDEKQREMLCKQQNRLPLTTRIYLISCKKKGKKRKFSS